MCDGTESFEPLAFIGVGTMGQPMLRNLVAAGVPVRAYDLRPDVLAALAKDGIDTAPTLADAVRGCAVAITMLPDTPDVLAIVLSEDGLATLLPTGSLVIDMSTIAASAATAIAGDLVKRGIGFLDAPVSGGVSGAIDGTLSIMVGGRREDFERAETLLSCLGKRIVHAGPVGIGQVFKACNQLMVASHIQALCEALALGRAHGVDLERLCSTLAAGAAGSWMVDTMAPRILADDASAGFRIDLQLKDLKLAGDAAFDKGVSLPGLALATALYLEARAHGEGGNGNQALFRTYDRMTNQTSRRDGDTKI